MNKERNDAVIAVLTRLATDPSAAQLALALTDLYDAGFEQGFKVATQAQVVTQALIEKVLP